MIRLILLAILALVLSTVLVAPTAESASATPEDCYVMCYLTAAMHLFYGQGEDVWDQRCSSACGYD